MRLREARRRSTRSSRRDPNERLTPDMTVRGRMMSAAEYRLHLELLRDAQYDDDHPRQSDRIFRKWLGRDMSDLQHDVWISAHQAGLLRQDHAGVHRLTPYGRVYLRQRSG